MKAMNRRKFLKGSLLGGAAASVVSKSKNADASASFGGYPDAMGVLVDLTRCVGCRSCEAACNKERMISNWRWKHSSARTLAT